MVLIFPIGSESNIYVPNINSTHASDFKNAAVPAMYLILLWRSRTILSNHVAMRVERIFGLPNVGHVSFLVESYKADYFFFEVSSFYIPHLNRTTFKGRNALGLRMRPPTSPRLRRWLDRCRLACKRRQRSAHQPGLHLGLPQA